MKVDFYPEIIQVVDEFKQILQKEHSSFLWQRESEPAPEHADLSFTPILKEETLVSHYDSSLCTLCERRISYKFEQFSENRPELPFLILKQNAFLAEHGRHFHNPEENALYEKIIKNTTGNNPSEFLVREVLRCHFGKEDLKDRSNIENCKKNILNDIHLHSIKGILIFGSAASMLFEDRDYLNKVKGTIISFLETPCVITPGASRLLYMQNNNFSPDKILAEKKQIFKAVNLFKSEIMKK